MLPYYMSTQTDSTPDPPQLTDTGRWSGEVVETGRVAYRWGTHTFPARAQVFSDGSGNLQVAAPSSPPPSAREIVVDGLASDTKGHRAIAAVLAEKWEIDIEEVIR